MGDGIFNKINNASHLHRSLCLFNFTTFSLHPTADHGERYEYEVDVCGHKPIVFGKLFLPFSA